MALLQERLQTGRPSHPMAPASNRGELYGQARQDGAPGVLGFLGKIMFFAGVALITWLLIMTLALLASGILEL